MVVFSHSIVSNSLQPHGLYIACQDPLSREFSRQECWSVLPFPSPGELPNPGIKTGSPALQVDSLPAELTGKPGSVRSRWNMDIILNIILK